MITRTSQPANGALLLSEMKEFGGFSKATQRYIRRSLDVAYGRRDAIECWARDEAEAASIRAQARLYKQLDHLRLQVPDDSGLDMIEPFIGTLDHFVGLRPRPGPPAQFRRLPLPLRAPGRRLGAPVAAGGLLRRRGASAPSPRPPPHAAAVDQRKRRDRAGLVEPRAGLLAGVGRKGRPARGRLSHSTFVLSEGRLHLGAGALSSRRSSPTDRFRRAAGSNPRRSCGGRRCRPHLPTAADGSRGRRPARRLFPCADASRAPWW